MISSCRERLHLKASRRLGQGYGLPNVDNSNDLTVSTKCADRVGRLSVMSCNGKKK